MKKRLLILLMAMSGFHTIRAQSIGPKTINAAGGSGTIGSTELEWSIGEMTMVSTLSSSGIVVTQGVLQPADNYEGVKSTSSLSGQLQVFPNPVISEVNLKYTSQNAGTLNYRLIDMNGKVITEHAILATQGVTLEKINVADLACANYMLEVTVNQGSATSEKATFKISKTK